MGNLRRMLWCVVLSACGAPASKPVPTPVPEPEAPPPRSEDLAILPVGEGKFPRVAAAYDQALREATLPGATARQAPVSMEVVQLSIECVEPTPSCHSAVAQSLQADQILFARIAQGGMRGEVRVEVMRTNAAGGTVGAATWTYKTEAEAIAAAKELVTRALSASGQQGAP